MDPKKAREAKGYSQRYLAKLVKTTQKTVWLCEKTGRYPRQRTLGDKYRKVLGVAP